MKEQIQKLKSVIFAVFNGGAAGKLSTIPLNQRQMPVGKFNWYKSCARFVFVFGLVGLAATSRGAVTFVAGATTTKAVCMSSSSNSVDANLAANDASTTAIETWSVLSGPVHGSVSGFPVSGPSTGGVVTPGGTSYSPAAGYVGLDSFDVSVSNSSSVATIRVIVTVSGAPSAGTISGVTTFCQGSTNTLTDAVSGGTWTSSNASIASVNSSGLVFGVSTGTAIISYTVTGACGTSYATRSQTVNPLPVVAAITGTTTACAGFSSALADSTAGGSWSSSNLSIATVNSSGVVFARAVGMANITYSVANSCGTTRVVTAYTVTPGISAGSISGATIVCEGANTTLTSTVSGGVWSSTDVSIASVDPTTGVVTGIAAGSVAINYTVTTSCGSTSTSSAMSVNPVPSAGTITGGGSPCPGTTITLADATAGGTWSSSNTAIASVDAAGVVTGIAGGTVTISYTVTNSCGTASAITSVTVNPTATAGSISGVGVVCVGSTTTLTDAVAGGTWATSNAGVASISASGIVTGVASGSATISYTATTACGTATAVFTITVNTAPTAGTITGASSVCVGATTTLSDAVSGGSWRSSNATIASISTGGVVRGVTAGTVTISYLVITSCGAATATMSFTVNPAPSAGTITGAATSCVGTSSTLSDAVSGGTWSSSNTSIATIDAAGVVTGVATGSAIISYQVTGTCGTSTAVVTFVVNSTPTAGTITGTSTICAGTTTSLSDAISGGTWTTSDASVASVDASGNVTGLSAGSATISYTVTSGCGSAVATFSITIDASGSAGSVSGASTVCIGAVTTFTTSATGGIWTTSDASIASVDATTGDVTGIAAGSATISYSVSGSCGTGFATAGIAVNTAPSAGSISGASFVCVGTSVTHTDATAGGAWSSSDGSVASVDASGNVTGISAGTATISYTVTTACGTASTTSSIAVIAAPSAGAITGATTVCTGSTTTLTDAAAGGVWSSSNAAIASVNTSGNVTGVAVGSAVISYTVTNSCGTATATASISVSAGASAGSISGVSTMCAGATATLTASVTGGTWGTSDASVASVSTAGVVTAVAAGTVTISYSITSGCGTTAATRTITIDPLPAAGTITGITAICVGSGSTLSDAVTGGTWSSSAAGIATVNTAGIVTGIAAGTATISYTVTGSCGTGVATTTVTVNAVPLAGTISGASAICSGSSTTLSVSVTGGVWATSNAAVASISSTGVVTGVTTGAATITYTVTNASGCSSFTTFNIASGSGAPTGTISPSGTQSLCGTGSSIHLTVVSGAAGLAYQWFRNGVLIAGATGSAYNATSGGTYVAIINNGCGADTLAGVAVVASPNPVITLSGISTLSTGSFTTYQWYLNGTAISGATGSVYVYSANGIYTVRVTNAAGCAVTSAPYTVSNGSSSGVTEVNETINVTIYPNPTNAMVHIEADVKVNVVVLTAVGRTVIAVKDAMDINLSDYADGMYMIMVYDENNQLLKAAKMIKVQ